MRSMILATVLAAPLAAATTNVVFAQSVPPPKLTQAEIQALAHSPAVQAAMAACSDDRWRLCGGVLPGGGRILRCLAANSAQVSPACRSAIDNAAATVAAARNAR
jgi:hypothetical protein